MQSLTRCEVLLFQAGADSHIDDPLGGVLTTAQMARCVQLVFEAASRMGIPVVWNLAGGYQTPLRNVPDLHDNRARAFAEPFYGIPPKIEAQAMAKLHAPLRETVEKFYGLVGPSPALS